MKFSDFWYIVARSSELGPKTVLARTVLDEWLVIFRDRHGTAVALRDRCLHRHSRLSSGQICRPGQIQCPYHGWVYNGAGQVVEVPSEGQTQSCPLEPEARPQGLPHRAAPAYTTCEVDDYIYVCLSGQAATPPFGMPYYGQSGWQTVRLVNRFANTVTNCVENFIDIPHTVSVHPGIFRTRQRQELAMTVTRRAGAVVVEYRHEQRNLGWASWFLNPLGREVYHRDSFHMPNVTSVEYKFSRDRHLFITSQAIPETESSTLVYTDVTYNYGLWNHLARPWVHWTAQTIIHQDIEILKIQGETIAHYGEQFCHTPADTIHVWVESIRNAIATGQDPHDLSPQTVQVKFWV